MNRRPYVTRILRATGPEAKEYAIVDELDDSLVVAFRTDGVNGKSNHETAEANLADVSEQNSGSFLLFCEALLMARAEAGIVYSLRPDRPGQLREEVAA